MQTLNRKKCEKKQLEVIFRVDASTEIGIGHLMRCLTLAQFLYKKNANITFISRFISNDQRNLICQKGFNIVDLSAEDDCILNGYERWLGVSQKTDAKETVELISKKFKTVDWLIVDHYAINITWEKNIRPYVKKIMVIDDLANRVHDCDILLDQNLYQDMEKRYEGLVPKFCKKFLGPQHALIREDFILQKPKLQERKGEVNRILVFFGGSDLTNETSKAIDALKMLNIEGIQVDVVVGSLNPNKSEIEKKCFELPNFNYLCQVNNMAYLIAKADIAIGAGGTSLWERCYLGLPSVTIIVAENQKEVTETVAQKGAVVNLGWFSKVSAEDLKYSIQKCINHPECLKKMSRICFDLMGLDLDVYNSELINTIVGGN